MTMPFYVPGPEGGMVPVDALPASTYQERRAERDARWAELARGGMSGYQIAAQDGVAVATVYLAMRRIGIPMRAAKAGASRNRSIERARRVNEIYQREGTLEAAGKVLGITRERVRQILVAGGLMERIDLLARNSPTPEQIAAARHDFDHGLGVDAIAVKHGISVGRARERLRASGLELKRSLGRRKRMIPYEEVRAKYEAGVRVADLAVEYGRKPSYIYRAIAKAGGHTDGQRRPKALP